MKRKLKEKLSLEIAKNPGRVVLLFILLMNLLFFFGAGGIIYRLMKPELGDANYWQALYYTITMVLDAGCIQFVVEKPSEASAILIIVCLIVILFGMILFTGAVIGYLTNVISGFIDASQEGRGKLTLSGHTIILNWNSRAVEIVNDLLYSPDREVVVVLVNGGKKQIEKEISDRIADTLSRENAEIDAEYEKASWFTRIRVRHTKHMKKRIAVIVREGDTYSMKQLQDISVDQAKSIVILGRDRVNSDCRYEALEQKEGEGNTDIIKTLVQVADLTAAMDSADDQRIVVEAEDDWTLSIIYKIIERKERGGKCNIIPVSVNRMLGQILSQFSIMPELNQVYQTLFSNKGAAFFCHRSLPIDNQDRFFRTYLDTHNCSIPLGFLESKEGLYGYYMSDDQEAVTREQQVIAPGIHLTLKHFEMPKKNVIILGHNSKSHYVMEGFNSFRNEWNIPGDEIMEIMVIDDEESLKKQNYYRDYEQVDRTVAATIYEREKIISEINQFVDAHEEDVSVLILSDDKARTEDLDGTALIYLIYVEEIIQHRLKADPSFDIGKIDIIVEILNPKNSDVVRSYSVNNVVISNRYVSKMMTQLAEKQALFAFYSDILTYDEADGADRGYSSREIYVKTVGDFFGEIPPVCTAASLIRAVYQAGPMYNKTMVLGLVNEKGEPILFDGNQELIEVELHPRDKLIVYTNH